MDTREVLRRFRAEREALSRMDHPGIARVMDAGPTPGGRPFFAMEYIDGLPLLDYFEEVEADLATRLRCFVSVCRALEHAHQKGVIHRDVKPSNVLGCLSRGEPQLKGIDFGVGILHERPQHLHLNGKRTNVKRSVTQQSLQAQ